MSGCLDDIINYEMKARKNLCIQLNTAAYEIFKQKLYSILHSDAFQEQFTAIKEIGKDKGGNETEIRKLTIQDHITNIPLTCITLNHLHW